MTVEITLQVAASGGDATQEEATGTMDVTSLYAYLKSSAEATIRKWPGFRFTGENLPPKGSTIIEVYLQVYVQSTTNDDANGNLHFEKAASPNVFTATAHDITNRPRTTESTSWIANTLLTGWKDSPSLVPALQELIDAYDITAIVVIGRPNTDTDKTLSLRTWDYSSNQYGAKLYIKYALPIQVPEVQTDAATDKTQTGAKLHGTLLDDGGEACDVRFEYGVKPALDHQTNWQEGKVTDDEFEASIVDLLPATTYTFRAIAENSEGTHEGDTLEFTTESPPPPPPVTKKVLVTHPAIKEVEVQKDGQPATKYENLSNLAEQRIETAVELPVEVPATLLVTSLSGETWTYTIT